MKIFISHSSDDKELVLMLVDLLINDFRLNREDVFCTSLDNALVVGEDFIKRIKENLHDCEVIMFLITQNYISSNFCIMEMGAAWAFKDNIVPIIVPPLDYSILNNTPMKTVQALLLNDYKTIFTRIYEDIFVKKNVIQRLSVMQEHELLNKIESFTKSVKKYVNDNFGFNFKDSKIISVAQNGDPEATKLISENDTHKLYCNFEPNKYYPIPSNFISCVYQFFPHKDWSIITSDSILSFICRSEDESISKITLELKCGDNLFKFYEDTFIVSKEYKKIDIPINYNYMPKKNLKDMSEICFVVRPNFANNFIAQIEIKDLSFQNNEITGF